MNKRDLKADSEQIQNFRSKWRQSTSLDEAWDIGEAWECFCREKAELWEELWLDQALAEKERADKAEALARELARELEEIKKRGDWLERDCTEPDKVMIYAIDISIIGNGTLAKAKGVHTEAVAWECVGCPRGQLAMPVDITCRWITRDLRKDPDNVSAGVKFILDGLVQAGILPDDRRKQINSIKHEFGVDKQNPRVEIVIKEAG